MNPDDLPCFARSFLNGQIFFLLFILIAVTLIYLVSRRQGLER